MSAHALICYDSKRKEEISLLNLCFTSISSIYIVSGNPHNHPAQKRYPFIDAGKRLGEMSTDLRSVLTSCV